MQFADASYLCWTEVPRWGQAVNQGWLVLVPCLGPLSESYGAVWGQMVLAWEILGQSEVWTKTGHSFGKATGNSLCGLASWWGWSQGITSVGQTVWAKLMGECLLALWGEGWSKEQQLPPALPSGRKLIPSTRPDVRQFRSSLYVSSAFQAAASVLELKGSKSE